MARTLSHDVAVVTGAGRGIGRAIALSLAGEGAAVGVFARTEREIAETAALISDAGGRALARQLDVKDAAGVRAAMEETARRLGPITLLVNNAGTPGPAGLDWEVDADTWFECIDVIVRGAFLLCQAVVPAMIERGSGRIINIASVSGDAAGTARQAGSRAPQAEPPSIWACGPSYCCCYQSTLRGEAVMIDLRCVRHSRQDLIKSAYS